MKISNIIRWLIAIVIILAGNKVGAQGLSTTTSLYGQIDPSYSFDSYIFIGNIGFGQDYRFFPGAPLTVASSPAFTLLRKDGVTTPSAFGQIYPNAVYPYDKNAVSSVPYVGPYINYNNILRARWAYAMVAPNTISGSTGPVCGNSTMYLMSVENWALFSDVFVQSYVVWEYQINGSTQWQLLSEVETSGSDYEVFFKPTEKIPEVLGGTKSVRFRCRVKAKYSNVTYYSPYSAVTSPIEILAPAPVLNRTLVQTTNTCKGESMGSIRVPSGAVTSAYPNMRWILRPGAAVEPCFPGGANTTCGNGIAQSAGNVPVSDEISINNLPEDTYSLWFVNPGEETGNCFASYVFTVSSFPAITVTENAAQRKHISCYNANDGTIGITATGGDPTGQYLFTLLHDDNTVYRSEQAGTGAAMLWQNLPAGKYKVSVRNSKCPNVVVGNFVVELTQPVQMTGQISTLQPTCNTPGNGSITITANTTVAKYRYELYKSGTLVQQSGSVTVGTYTFNGLAGGTYSVTLYNDEVAGCPGWSAPATLNVPTPLSLQLLSRDSVSCNGGADGRLEFKGAGGSNAFTYTLSGGAMAPVTNTTGVFGGLKAGTYNIQLTNQAAGCNDQITQAVSVFQRTPLNVQLQATGISCYGADDASLHATVSGGSGNYRYTWQELKNGVWTGNGFWFDTDTKIEALSAGTYRVIITDASATACTVTSADAVIAPATELKITGVTITDAVCLADGARIAMTGTGGTGVYTYSWSLDGGGSYQPFTATTPITTSGTYQLRLSDARGCRTDAAATYNIVLPPAALDATIAVSNYNGFNISCKDAGDGKITVTATGGNGGAYAGYQYSLNNGAYQSSAVFDHLAAGVYAVKVKDGRGCVVTKNITLMQPALNISVTKNDITCYGASTGSITTNISGGAAPYVLRVNGATATAGVAVQQLPQGTYVINVTDANGCTKDTTIDISYKYPALTIHDAVVSDIVCYGSAGHININAAGGDGVHTFSISNDNWATSDNYVNGANLQAGNYKLRLTDGQGCTTNYPDDLLITAPAAPLSFTATLSDYNGFNISCAGGSNGYANISASGGNGAAYSGYTYALDNNPYTNASLVEQINAGTHVLRVKDGRGCVVSNTFNFTQSAAAISLALVSKQDVTCAYVPAGSFTVAGSGGVGALQYSIDNRNWQSGATFSGLAAGTYTVMVKDLNSCGTSLTVQVGTTNPAIVIDNITARDIICYGQKGSIQITAHGGTGALTNEYAWNGGNYDHTFNNNTTLEEGTYTIRVKDAAGCYSRVSNPIKITAPATALNATITTSDYHGVAISCYGLADGRININAAGGNGANYAGYRYSINNSAFSNNNSYANLAAGNYTVKVIDGRGCELSRQLGLSQPAAALSLAVSSKEDLPCGANPTGKITLNATGGTGPYTYTSGNNNWQNAPVFTNLPAADYALQVKDINGCTATTNTSIKAMYPAINSASVVTPVSCNGLSDGALTINVTGGDGRYTYEWNVTGVSGNKLQQLSAGTYTVKVTDGAGCFRSFTNTVPQPVALSMEVSAPAICDGVNNGTIDATVNGGTRPYKYALNNSSWLTSGSFTQIEAGRYNIKVQDAHGCEVAKDFEITKLNTKPYVNFLVASRRNAFDTLIIKDISLPAPESITWSYSPEATLLGYDNGIPLIKFASPGNYWVAMTATFGTCTYSERKDLQISPYDPLAGPVYTQPVGVIDTVYMSPNPNNGNFSFTVKLNRKQRIVAYVYDLNGIVADKRQYAPTLQVDDKFSIGSGATGIFILRIITESESKDIRFIISR
ncbi:T9SS type A sorting domain-containing protein [Chitinophaga filiformis]|uniref:T9SS type A sorting domain-containing protein n=1 Tax=Chitinophaga filiformis TaxID=104663 RepID=UPI001F176C61|nr:T9SS type A sorting domain-containing protein [Chitinophaga filiformis]MCF6404553.1 T9SS type A sorting domain-containing protein [Chitinophaga filiformis]